MKAGIVAASLRAGLLLTHSCVPIAMKQFGVIVPGVGTIHAPATARGIAALLQKMEAYANTNHFFNPVLLILINGAVAWCYNLDTEGWKPIVTSNTLKSKL